MPSSPHRHHHALASCPVLLVRPRYPENLGAVARAMRVTGFQRLVLVQPHPLAHTDHPQARKMAVGSEDVLDAARVVDRFDQAVAGAWMLGTSARAGIRGVVNPRDAAARVVRLVGEGRQVALVFGGERTGLRREEVQACDAIVRIPMVGNEPSLNLAQSVMIVLYELLVAALPPPQAPSRS